VVGGFAVLALILSAVGLYGLIAYSEELWDSRYIWMPLEMEGGKMRLPEPKPFRINVHTGEVQEK
jgi:hypothetical protein